MSFEFPPLVADWLADPAYGVNALLPSIPRDAGDPVPPDVAIVDEIRQAWCARRQIPAEAITQPTIAVLQSGEATYQLGRAQQTTAGARVLDGEVSLLLLFIQRENDSARGASYARYTLRAALGSLLLLHDPASGAVRTRNGAQLVTPTKFSLSTLLEERGDVLVTGGVLATYTTRECVPVVS